MTDDTERRVYEYIVRRYNDGTLPSVRDICEAVGFRSAATAHRYIARLCSEGLVDKCDNASRSVRPSCAGAVLVPLLSDNASPSGSYVCWGAAMGAHDNIFAIKPRFGMPDAAILPGDTVIAKRCDAVSPSATAVIRKPDGSVGVSRGGRGGELLGTVIAVQRQIPQP